MIKRQFQIIKIPKILKIYATETTRNGLVPIISNFNFVFKLKFTREVEIAAGNNKMQKHKIKIKTTEFKFISF